MLKQKEETQSPKMNLSAYLNIIFVRNKYEKKMVGNISIQFICVYEQMVLHV